MLDKQAAIFGEASWKFTDQLKLTAGLRYSDLQYYGVVQEVEQGLFGTLNVNTPSSGNSRPVTPRFVFNYQPTVVNLFFASTAKGLRPGGINTGRSRPLIVFSTGLFRRKQPRRHFPRIHCGNTRSAPRIRCSTII